MFEKLEALPSDPILGLNQVFQKDSNPDKINLSIGVYQDSDGNTPIFSAVKKAEDRLMELEKTKSYVAQAGDPGFLQAITTLLLGADLVNQRGSEIATVMTPGGCGALRMAAELLVSARSDCTVWVSNPTWANHFPLLGSAGLQLKTYDYYDSELNGIDFEAMLLSLTHASKGDVVLLHGCCHNPTGADLTQAQWDQIIELMREKQLLAFIDVAYQGFGQSLDEDAYGVRKAIERLPEVLVASSCSKNFGLYRERTGALMIVSESAEQTLAARSHVLSAARRSYSMSPYHGAGIVATLLADPDLTTEWRDELRSVRQHMENYRNRLADELNNAQNVMNFDFIAKSNGMFCYLGIPRELVLQLREKYSIYLLDSTRINIAGLSDENLPIVVDRVAGLLTA